MSLIQGHTVCLHYNYFIAVVQSLSRVQLFATPWTAAHQASLSLTISWSLLKLMSIESVMQSNHLTLCRPLLLPPSVFPSISVFSNESALCIRWPKYWSFSFSPSNEYSGLISFRKICLHLISKFSHVILPQNHIPNSLYFWGAPKSLQMVTAAMKLKDAYSLEEKL